MGWLIDLLPLSYTDAVVVIGAAILGLTSGVLGSFAVLRERSLVGDAIAHAALPGVCIAFLVTGAKDAGSLIVGAAFAGIAAAVLMVAIERTSRIRPDAAIGVVLSCFFSLGIVLLTYISSQNNANQAGLEKYLFGQAAGLLERDLVVMAVLACASLLFVAVGFRILKVALFDADFAGSLGLPVRVLDVAMTLLLVVAVVIGVRMVGAILMVAMLITPVVAARQLTHRLRSLLPLAGVIGAGIGITGALLATRAELPTGPVVVVVGFCVALAAVLLSPGRGALWRARHVAVERSRAAFEGVLLEVETAMHAGPPPTAEELRLVTGRPRAQLARTLRRLERTGLLHRDGEEHRLRLTEAGAAAAHAMEERRDLWAAWLEYGASLDLRDAREPDPRDVRASLGDDVADRLQELAR
ncbi:MAG: metal ABC transporter permease [Solirubrobacteraceae bacterium]